MKHTKLEKFKAWFGIALIAWPVAKAVMQMYGVPLPDLAGMGDTLGIISQAGGTAVLAQSKPVVQKAAVT